MSELPPCPECKSEYSYEMGALLVCPECAHEWNPSEEIGETARVVKDSAGNVLSDGDDVTIIKDMLSDIFGYDKYSEVTSEFAIRGTYCDLAIKFDNKLATLIEAKAIGIDLKEQHVKQAVDYAANQGIDWVILTNGNLWKVYKLIFSKPIDKELVVEIDFLQINSRLEKDIEKLYLLCKEGWLKSALGAYHTQQQALSRYFVGSILQTDSVLDVIRRELRRVSPDVKIDNTPTK